MSDFLDRISKLSPKRLALLALEQHEQLEAANRSTHGALAVIGMACRFPGGAGDPAAFWDLLREGRDAIREVPADRWDIDSLFDPDPDAPGRVAVRTGGFLDNIGEFDAAFFGIAPREALTMDPQQRLLLEVTWEAVEHAGLAPERLMGSNTGVFVGICNSDHFNRVLSRGTGAIDAYLASGNAHSVAAGRISYCLGLEGPSMSIDTSCSSSLVALHVACRSLRSGESRIALAAGVNVMCAPETTISLSKAHMLAPDGRCKPFDASADGFARGEGCGVLVLKRLEDALADGDRVLALVRGTAVNQDGRSGGLTVPNGRAQEAVIRAALSDGLVTAADIDYVEAHGTGTSLGDPIEVNALAAALGRERGPEPLLIGSVKTNIGHLESAAGIAGVIKVVLALQNEHIPPHLHFRQPSPHIAWDQYAVKVAAAGSAWPRGARRRLAGISSFGFSGTNAHAIVEEAPAAPTAAAEFTRPVHCLPVSARSPEALLHLAAAYEDRMALASDVPFLDVVHTAGLGRSHLSERVAVIAATTSEARAGLRALHSGESHPMLRRGSVVSGAPCEVVFVFTGQGSQYPGMAQALYEHAPVFRAVIDRCDSLLGADHEGRTLKSVLWEADSASPSIHQTRWTQPALFAVEYGLTQLWRSWGIEPAAVIGHSVGEYVAACVAGVFTLEEGLRLIAKRGRLMDSLPPGGTMAALFAPAAEIAAALVPVNDRVAIAAINAADSVVISGEAATVEGLLKDLARREIRGHRLFISLAAHSPLVEPVLDEMEACAGAVTMRQPQIPIAWNLTGGQPLPNGGIPDATYWRRHLREPVRFADGITELYAQGFRTFLEIGPHPTLTALAQRSLPEGECALVSSLRRGKNDWLEMLGTLADLYVRGANVDWGGVNGAYGGRLCTLPTYPFERRSYWLPLGTSTAVSNETGSGTGSLFYKLEWEAVPPARRAAPHLASPDSFVAAGARGFAALAARNNLAIYDELLPELDRLSAVHMMRALLELGFDPAPGRIFEADAERARLGILPLHARLFTRILGALVEDGWLRRKAGGVALLEVVRAFQQSDPTQQYEALLTRFGSVDDELRTLHRCATHLAGVLRGTQDALQLLFPDGQLTEALQLYVESTYARTYNAALAQALAAAIAALPVDARLRVLEIGAGTGGTTGYVLPMLPAERVEYTFTDLSPLFLEQAAQRFAAYPFMRRRLLNIERDPAAQGFEPGEFDIIIAANVLHATADLTETMTSVRNLLAPGGLLFLLEGVVPERWADLTGGLTGGWSRFTDIALRPDYPLIDRPTWRDLLGRCGFEDAHAIPDGATLGRGASQQAIIIARACVRRRHWTIVGDVDGLGATLARLLRSRGEIVVQHASDVADAGLTQNTEWIYLGALELEKRDPDDGGAVRDCESLACEAPLRWLGDAVRQNLPLRAWLVTRGTQVASGPASPGARWQAPLWGIGRVFALEQPRRWGGLVDLSADATLDSQAEVLLRSIDEGDIEDQIAWRNGKRFVARLLTAEPPTSKPASFAGDATYLIVGGFGGLGPLVARWMVENGARHLALLGRHPDMSLPAIKALEARGARVIALAGDVADEVTLRGHLSRLADESPPLRGIVHAAVAFSGAPIGELTADQVREALRSKVRGTVTLQRLTRDLDLDFTVLFSSTTAITGVFGMAHYAAANEFLNATARAAEAGGKRVLSVNWGAWDTIRLASEEAQRGYREGGLLPMVAADALKGLQRLLGGRESQAIVARIDWNVMKPVYEARRVRPLLTYLGRDLPDTAVPGRGVAKAPAAPGAVLNERLARVPAIARHEVLVEFVRGEVAAVLGAASLDSVDLDAGLFEMGMDSLMSVELRRRLEVGAGRKLPSTLTFNYPNVGALAGFLLRELDVAETSVVAAVAFAPPPGSPIAANESLDELSDDELEARLLARLTEAR